MINKQFTDAANRVIALAEQEVRAFNHEYIGTEHILLGLIQEGSGTVSDLLKTLGVDPSEIHHEIEGLVQRGPNSIAAGTIPLTPRARRVIECASDEVKFMNEASVGPEHLLLGLFREPDGVASRALRNLGLQIGQVVTEVFRIRLEQMKIVERAVRPVPAGTAWKRKTREELLAHLTSIYDEEQERMRDPAAAMREAVKRFGDPTELARELAGALPVSERRSHYLELVRLASTGDGGAIHVAAIDADIRRLGSGMLGMCHRNYVLRRMERKHVACCADSNHLPAAVAGCSIPAGTVLL